MKKILSLALVLAMMLTMSVTAFASEIKQDSENKTGSTNITHTVSESYVVTIPDSMTVGTEATVSVSGVVIAKDRNLAVSVSSTQYDNGWKLKNNDDTLGYTLKIDNKDVVKGGIVLTALSGETVSKKLTTEITEDQKPKYSGAYTDTVTFEVEVKEPYSYDATSKSADELKTVVKDALDTGWRNLSITLSSNADAGMTQAIGQGMIEAGVEDSSVNLTLNGLETLPGNAFYKKGENGDVLYGKGLKTLSLPDATIIEPHSFYTSGLVSVLAPEATEVQSAAFERCSNLTSVSLPKAIKISVSAFSECTKLTSVNLPNATSIGVAAFHLCPIKSLTLTAEGTITLDTSAFNNPGNIDLVLNSDKQSEVTNENEWNGYTFKSITFV